MERSFLRIEKRELFDPQWICEELIDENRGCIKEEYQGQKGYLRFIKERFGQKGSMSTIFDKVSKTFKEDSIKRPNWKKFPGKVFEYKELERITKRENFVERYRGQHTGYPRFAVRYVSGDMLKAFKSISCILDKLQFKELAWQQFPGSVREFQGLPGKILKDNGFVKEKYKGQKGYLQFSKDHYGDDMRKAFMSVSCVLDKLQFKELDWQAFPGSVREFQELSGKILRDNSFVKWKYKSQEGYLQFAKDHYGADMKKAFASVSCVLDKLQFKELGWQGFSGSVAKRMTELLG